MRPFLMPDDADAFDVDHDVETSQQVDAALVNLRRKDADWVEWPWPHLTALVGRMKPRDVWFACGFSGNGKTLFVSSAVQEWIKRETQVYVLPLENTADDFRLYLACQNVGIDPGLVNGGSLLDMAELDRMHWDKTIAAEIARQAHDATVRKYLKVKGVDEINLKRLALAAEEAKDWGAKVLIVDHIDQIEGGDGKDLYGESVRVNKGAKKLARKYELVFLFTSQMNNDAVRGNKDRLAQFAPPQPHHVFMGAHKRMIATGMIGLHRKIRDKTDDESDADYIAALKRSRDGDAPPLDALQPNVMAVTSMKSRNFGAREGARCFLAVEHGRVLHLAEKDTHRTTYDGRKQI